MKRSALTIFCLLCVIQLWAGPVDRSVAQAEARKFFLSRGIQMKPSRPAFRAPRKATAAPDNSYYYIFDAGDDRGYVIVSGDDRTATILGYVDNGTFDADRIPENMRSWLQLYADQIKYMDDHGVEAPVKSPARKAAQKARHTIEPLLPCLWNQGSPYNEQVPYYTDNSGNKYRCATGCVATAIAQMMYYYRYPSKTTGGIGSLKCNGSDSGYKVDTTLAWVSSGEVIDWDNMRDTYDSQNGLNEAEKNAIARFNLLVGQAFQMGYGPSSGATLHGAQPLKRIFGYDKSTHTVTRDAYGIDAWTNLIYSEVAGDHPVVMSGFSSGGGHAFVVDGYDGNGMFHINWGWGGYQNGYFLLTVMNPGDNSGTGASSSSDGYSMSQEIMLVRVPGQEPAPGADVPASLTMNDTQIEQDSVVFCNYINWTGVRGTYKTGVGLVGDDGTYTPIGWLYSNGQATDQQTYSTTLSANYYNSLRFVVTRTGLAPGTYKVVPICQPSGSKMWVSSFNPELRYIKLVVNEQNTVKLTYVDGGSLAVDSIVCSSDRVRGREQTVDVTFSNQGDTEYYGEVRLFASLTTDKGTETSRVPVSLKPGQRTTQSFFFTPKAYGTYNLWVATGSDGSGVLGQSTVKIASSGVYPKIQKKGSMTFYNMNSSNQLVGNMAVGHIRVANQGTEPYQGNIVINIWRANHGVNSFYMQTTVKVPVTLAANTTAEVPFRFSGLALGYDYGFNVCYTMGGSEREIMGLGDVHQTVGGMLVYDEDGSVSVANVSPGATYLVPATALAVDAGTMTSLPVFKAGQRHQNTVLVLPAGASVPSGLVSLNVVRGTVADSISIDDDQPFFTPVTFTAKQVKYTRVLDMTKEWETIALPFTPEHVRVDGRDVNWTQRNSLLVMKEFSEVNDSGLVKFSYPARLYDNTPYIIASPLRRASAVVFSADDAVINRTGSVRIIANTDTYNYMGTVAGDRLAGVYVMNAGGTAFEPVEDVTAIQPFRAYFTTTLPEGVRAARLPLDPARDFPTDIAGKPVEKEQQQVVAVYSLSGQQLQPGSARGVVIVRYADGTTRKELR